MKRTRTQAFTEFREELFQRIFDDYAQSSDQWLDFIDYRKRAVTRMQEVLDDHSQKLIRFLIDEHYERVRTPKQE